MKTLLVLGLIILIHFQMLAQSAPGSPALFLEGDVSTSFNERDMAISPDGTEMFYTFLGNENSFSAILHRKKMKDGKWSKPVVASFSGKFGDLEPAFSADGKKLFFCSNRPLSGDEKKDYDIWVVEKKGDQWSDAKNLDAPVNTPANEFYPSVAANGNIYFTAAYNNGIGEEDIFVSRWVDGAYTKSEPLDTMVNSKTYEFNAYVSPDESLIIFTSYGRKDDKGGGDLYIGTRDENGKWTPARNLSELNSNKLDYCPFVSFDKKTFYFTSSRHQLAPVKAKVITYDELIKDYSAVLNGSENIYWVSFDRVK